MGTKKKVKVSPQLFKVIEDLNKKLVPTQTIHSMMYTPLQKISYDFETKDVKIIFIDESCVFTNPETEKAFQVLSQMRTHQQQHQLYNKVMDQRMNAALSVHDYLNPEVTKSSIIKNACERQGIPLVDLHMNRDEDILEDLKGLPRFEGCPHGCPDAPKQHKFSCPY